MIKAFIFDWGGVLITHPIASIIEQTAAYFNVSEEDIKQQFTQQKQAFQTGTLSEQAFWEQICTTLNLPPPKQMLWKTFFHNAYVENKELFRFAAALKTQGYTIGFLSNTEPPSREYFYEQSYTLFDAAVFSCTEGWDKPHPHIYYCILEKLNVQPSEAVLVDDSIENIQGAHKIGMQAIPFTTNSHLKRTLHQIL